MRVGTFLKSSGFAAIAAAMAIAAVPTTANAQERGGRDRGSWSQGGGQSGQQTQRGGNSGRQGGESWGGGGQRQQAPQRVQREIRQQAPQQRADRGAQVPRADRQVQRQPAWGNQQRDNRPVVAQPNPRTPDTRNPTTRAPGQWRDPGRTGTQNDPRRDEQRGVNVWRGENGRGNDRPDVRRDDNRRPDIRRDDDRRGDNRGWNNGRNDNRGWNNNNNNNNNRNDNRGWNNNRGNDRPGYRDDRRDNRQWDRRWRDDRRYNWSSYRNSNRNAYRIGAYYAPYRNYSYRRLNIGFVMDSMFFGNRYWINDPWQYRLPNVYGSYRWVRYYNDVLLVDMYSGQVVDVINDFFW